MCLPAIEQLAAWFRPAVGLCDIYLSLLDLSYNLFGTGIALSSPGGAVLVSFVFCHEIQHVCNVFGIVHGWSFTKQYHFRRTHHRAQAQPKPESNAKLNPKPKPADPVCVGRAYIWVNGIGRERLVYALVEHISGLTALAKCACTVQ